MCDHDWTKWEVAEDDICQDCGMCTSEIERGDPDAQASAIGR